MKAYTDIKQSKELAKILPVESADMFYDGIRDIDADKYYIPHNSDPKVGKGYEGECPTDCVGTLFLPCWSIAALLEVIGVECRMEKKPLDQSGEFTYSFVDDYYNIRTFEKDNAVDAAVEMIYKLKEIDLL